MTTNIADVITLIAKLQLKLTALGDGRDAQSDNERAAFRRDYDAVQRVISGLMNPGMDKPSSQLADLEARRATRLRKQTEIEQEIATAPDPATFTTTRERDDALARQRDLRLQLQRLHDGTLFITPGVMVERLADIDARIKELIERRDRSQRVFDACIQQAEALLGETVTT